MLRGAMTAGRSRLGIAFALALCASTPRVARAELLDRLVAVVAGSPIMLSDVQTALEFGLIEVAQGEDAPKRALDQLIDRVLMFGEVERYGPGEPDPAAVATALGRVRDRLGLDRYLAALSRVGLDEARLAAWLRDDLRLERYLGQRFDALAEPTDDEVAAYYRDHPSEFTRDGQLLPLDDVQARLRERLATERREVLVAEWVASLRRRADIQLVDQVAR